MTAQKVSDWIAQGDLAMDSAEYYVASEHYRMAIELDSAIYANTIKYADALRLSRQYDKALWYYDKAYTKDRGRITPKALLYIAQLQELKADHKSSLKHYRKYKKKLKDRKSLEYKSVERAIGRSTYALAHQENDPNVELKSCDGNVNEKQSEFSPFLVDSTLFFSRYTSSGNEESTQILTASKKGDKYISEPMAIGPNEHQANYSRTEDGKYSFYVKCSEPGSCLIWMNEHDTSGSILSNRPLDELNDPNANNTMPFCSLIDEQYTLFFASDRVGSFGKLDIWSSTLENGKFGRAKQLYEAINSPGTETSPFYLDGYLYFSSDWWDGYGGLDVHKAKGKPGLWGETKNMGLPLNSSLNDLYFTYSTESNIGFVSSNRKGSKVSGEGYCCNDLYSYVHADSILTTRSVEETLIELNAYLPVTLYFHNDEPDPNTRKTSTELSYLDSYDSYQRLKQEYLRESGKGKNGEAKEEAQYEMEDFFSLKVNKGINDLDRFTTELLKELQKGTSVSLVVRGFASPRAESDYNINLTQRRISSLENYLRRYENGIFLPYMEEDHFGFSQLKLTPMPYGENKADASVEDNLDDQQKSIYSVGASLERKIEIEAVEMNVDPNRETTIVEDTHYFGDIPSGQDVYHTFRILNDGNKTLVIDSVVTSCGCTTTELKTRIIQPGEQTTLEVALDPQDVNGKLIRKILIYRRDHIEPLVLTLDANVVR